MPKGQKGINKMKKNIFKKIVASLATVAMAAGLFTAMPAEEAKAADPELYLVGTLVEAGWTPADAPAMVKGENNTYTYHVDNMKAGEYQFKVLVDNKAWGSDKGYYGEGVEYKNVVEGVDNDHPNGNGNFSIECYQDGTMTLTIVYVDGAFKSVKAEGSALTVKIDPSAVIEKINAIGTVTYTDDCLKKINDAQKAYDLFVDNGGAKADVANYSKLTDARAKYDELKAADDAQYAGKITIYAKPPKWEKVSLYGWTTDNDERVFGDWPGNQKLTEMKKNAGWYSCSFTMTEPIGVIFNNDNNGEQSADWTKMKPGTYWVDFSQSAKNDKGHFIVEDKNISTTAPSGWQDEAAQEVTVQTPAKKPAVDKGSVATKDDVAKIDKEAVVVGAPEGAKLDATEIAADSDAFKVVKEAAKTAFKNKAYVALDLKLLKGTEAVQPNGDVKVTIPVPSALAKAKKIAVYRVGDDNKLVSCGTADVADGKLTFTTNHFSTYVFADATPASNTGDAAPIVFMLAVAAVAASMVIASKKKTICE